jgi:hypothetical protein
MFMRSDVDRFIDDRIPIEIALYFGSYGNGYSCVDTRGVAEEVGFEPTRELPP